VVALGDAVVEAEPVLEAGTAAALDGTAIVPNAAAGTRGARDCDR
jgi:hypothetical protein